MLVRVSHLPARLSHALLALCLCSGCTALAGEPITAWERAPLDLAPAGEAPARVPDDLAFAPAEGVLVRAGPSTVACWLRTRVIVPDARDPVMLIPRAYVALAGYVDGARVVALDDYRAARGVPFYVVPLPRATGTEVTVTLRVLSRYTQVGLAEPPRIGDRSELVSSLLVRDVPRVMLGAVFLAAGLVALLFALGPRQRRAFIGIALFSCFGGWSLFQTRARQLWLPDLELWFGVWWVVPSLVSAGAALFVESMFGPSPRRVFGWFAAFFLAHAAVGAAWLVVSEALPLDWLAAPLFIVGRIAMVLGMLGAVAYLALRARRGQRDASFFLGGFAVASIGVFHDIAVSAGAVRDGLLLGDLSYFAIEVSLVAIVVRRLRAMGAELRHHAERLDRFVKERDALVRDLHDGLGNVVTSVKLVAERAREDEKDEGGALASIAELADQGMTELRTLMTGFDDLPGSYRELAAGLRRAGATMLEPRGIEQRFELAIDADGPGPDLARFVALSRVHREAVTNAIKHASPSVVGVKLAVTEDTVTLAVIDDGCGREASSPHAGTGRGIASMRARARAIGASLTIENASPRGTSVLLRMPRA